MVFDRADRLGPQVGVPLWCLRHASGHTIECSFNTHPSGLEFQAKLNARLLHRQVFQNADELLRSAERGKGRLESRGWTTIAMDGH